MNRAQTWIAKWVDLLVAVVSIVTLTLWLPRWSLDIRSWFIRRTFERRRSQRSQPERVTSGVTAARPQWPVTRIQQRRPTETADGTLRW